MHVNATLEFKPVPLSLSILQTLNMVLKYFTRVVAVVTNNEHTIPLLQVRTHSEATGNAAYVPLIR